MAVKLLARFTFEEFFSLVNVSRPGGVVTMWAIRIMHRRSSEGKIQPQSEWPFPMPVLETYITRVTSHLAY
jgi:hypothetical protein